MTCLMDRSLSGALIKLHTSTLGTFFVYTLAQSMLIFKKKCSQIFLGESCKLCVLHKNSKCQSGHDIMLSLRWTKLETTGKLRGKKASRRNKKVFLLLLSLVALIFYFDPQKNLPHSQCAKIESVIITEKGLTKVRAIF